MSEDLTREEMGEVSMQVILNAGDAREYNMSALKYIEEGNFEKAKEMMKLSKEKITIAHRSQTGMLQKEAEGINIPNSVLFNHAQDTLMTIQSEQLLISRMMKIFENIYKKGAISWKD